MFAGQIVTKVKCKGCGKVSERQETIHDIGFPVPTEKEFDDMPKKGKACT